MNESLLRRFCESRHRKLIVAIVTIVAAVAVLGPLTDEYFDKRATRASLAVDLDHARQIAETLDASEEQLTKLSAKHATASLRFVDEAGLGEYRTNLVELVRKSGCQLRRVDVGSAASRPWQTGDDPLVADRNTGNKAKNKKKSPFVLQRQSVTLVVDGAMENVAQLLGTLRDDSTLAYPSRFQLKTAGRRGNDVSLELELWVFALTRGKPAKA
jgi:hypothetical protein